MNTKMISMIRKLKDKRQQQASLANRSSPNYGLKTWEFYKIHSQLVLNHLNLHEKSEHSLFSKAALLIPLTNSLPQLKEAGFFSLEEIKKTICVRVDRIVKHKRENKETNKIGLETSAWQTMGQREGRYLIEIKGDLAVILRRLVTPGVLLAICGANVCTENRNFEEPLNFQVLSIPISSKIGPKLIMFDLNEDHITPINEFDAPTFSMLPVVVKCISGFKSQSYIKVNPSCVIRALNQIERVHDSSLAETIIVQNSTAQVPTTSVLKSQQLRLPIENHIQNSGQVPMDVLESQSLASKSGQIQRIMTFDVLESQLVSSQSNCPISVLESQRLFSQPNSSIQSNSQVPMDVLESQRLASEWDDTHITEVKTLTDALLGDLPCCLEVGKSEAYSNELYI